MTNHLFTPRHAQTGVRMSMQISTEDRRKTGRGEDWRAVVTNTETGQRYAVWGADCGAGRCFCDALCVEVDTDPATDLLRRLLDTTDNDIFTDAPECADSLREAFEAQAAAKAFLDGLPAPAGTHKITLLWAERPDPGDEAKTYRFATKGEYDAFMLGVSEANGWINVREAPEGYVVPEPDDQTDEDEEILSAQMF